MICSIYTNSYHNSAVYFIKLIRSGVLAAEVLNYFSISKMIRYWNKFFFEKKYYRIY